MTSRTKFALWTIVLTMLVVACMCVGGLLVAWWPDAAPATANLALVLGTILLVVVTGALVAVGLLQWQESIGTSRSVAEQVQLQRSIAQSSFNLDLLRYLDDVLLSIADHSDAYDTVWGIEPSASLPQDYGRAHVLTQSLCDVLALALLAAEGLPGFEANKDPWRLFARDVLRRSPAVKHEIVTHPGYWTTLDALVSDMAASGAESAAQSS